MADEDDGLEPLFDYGHQAPTPLLLDSDDDKESSSPPLTHAPDTKKKKKKSSAASKKQPPQVPGASDAHRVILGDDVDDSWLPPPPKCAKKTTSANNLTQMQIRMRSAQLLSISEKAKRDAQSLDIPSKQPPPEQQQQHEPAPPHHKKQMIIIKIQNKSGDIQSFRLGTQDQFHKLFTAYSNSAKIPTSDLLFRFDGDQLKPDSTPQSLDMENEDIIEVFDRKP